MDIASAVLVTHNRGNILIDCLKGIFAQSREVGRIHLINNASSDGTERLLRENGFLGHDKIDYVALDTNVGGAGGFRLGIERALSQESPDWIWLMDDDVVPRGDCLEQQMSFARISECIHPLVVYEDGSAHKWEHVFDPNSSYQIGLLNQSFDNGKLWCPMMVGCFEGMLISKRIIEKIGLPRSEFFISGDDAHYGFLASKFTNVIYVKTAVLEKRIRPSGQITPFRIYYDLRNRFLLRRSLKGLYESTSVGAPMFLLFMLLHTRNMIRRPITYKKLQAAAYAWKDGLAGVSGRNRY